MRIGEFSSLNNVTKDTIRHYMDMGLLAPEKHGGHYSFSATEQSILREIIDMKDRGFSLLEIKDMLIYKKLGTMTSFDKSSYLLDIYSKKLRHIEKERELLEGYQTKLIADIESLNRVGKPDNHSIGVDFSMLGVLCCHKCGSSFSVSDGQILNNMIYSGRLRCNGCDEVMSIEEGIVVGGGAIDETHHYNSRLEGDFYSKYMNEIDDSYLDKLYKNHIWIENNMNKDMFKNKTVIDLGSGGGLFLRNVFKNLHDDSIYIAIDHDITRHRFLKSQIEKADIKRNILFICCDFKQIPIRDKSVDIVADISGSSNYGFANTEFLLDAVDNLIKDDSILIGMYILFKKYDVDSIIAPEYRQFFNIDFVRDRIDKLRYEIMTDRTSEEVSKGGIYEDYFNENEIVYDYMILAKRR